MAVQHTITEHHAAAATHHEEAARFHRQASRHFETGKDPEHWAHQALLAHGHTLRAIESGNAACQFHASQEASILPKYLDTVVRFPSNALKTFEAMGIILDGFQCHAVAADQHEEAAQHHVLASRHYMAGNYSLASWESQLASHHAQNSLLQSREAANQQVDAYFDILLPSLSEPEQVGKTLAQNGSLLAMRL